MKAPIEKHPLNSTQESALSAPEGGEKSQSAAPPAFQLKSSAAKDTSADKGEEAGEAVQLMDAGGSGFAALGGNNKQASVLSDTIQRVGPTSELLTEYEGFSVEELKRDIGGNLYDSIHTVQQQRITNWLANAGIEETPPGRAVLTVALGILASGIGAALGGVIGGVITSTITSKITQEFLTGVSEASVEALLGAAQTGLIGLTNPTTGDESQAAQGSIANTAANGLAAYYAEGANLTLLDSKTTNVSSFNRQSSTYSRGRLIVMHKALRLTYESLLANPNAFLQNLTIGYMKLLDEVFLTDRASDSEGSNESERRGNMYSEDTTIDETAQRSGNLLITGPMGGIGEWSAPNFSISNSIVSGLNAQTRRHLAGAKIKDLPFSLTFRFWGSTPNRGTFGDVFCKVWFVKRGDGTIAVDMDQDWDRDSNGWDAGREWLARYATGNTGEMDEEMVRANVANGALGVYNQIKNMRLPANVLNTDLF